MIRRSAVSRADLVICYRQNPDCLDGYADLLGFERRSPAEEPKSAGVKASATAVLRMEAVKAEPSDPMSRITFWQHTKTEPHFVDTTAPVSSGGPTPRNVTEVLQKLTVPPPACPAIQQPLIPWNKLWPFARAALGTTVPSGRIDADALVRSVSKGRAVRSIPRKPKQTWAAKAQLIIDRNRRLVPFWDDQVQFLGRLRRWRGTLGLNVVFMHHGPGSAPSRLPASDVPILALSDLGCLDTQSGASRDWSTFGQALVAAGHRPVALLPCPRHQWRAPLDRLWRLACWDRGQPLPSLKARDNHGLRRTSAADDAVRKCGLRRLLACLSMLVNVEPGLLRSLRLLLDDGECDVATESDAWRHTDVDGGALTVMGLKKDAAVRRAHRDEFERMPLDAQEAVLALAHAHHDGFDKLEFFLEEVCHFAALGIAPRQLTDPARELFRQLACYLANEEVWAEDVWEPLGVAAWVHRAVTRLPPEVRRWREVSECWRLADKELRERAPQRPPDLPEGVRAWPMPPTNENDFTGSWWHVWQCGEMLSVVPAEAGVPPADRPGAPLATIRAMSPQFEVVIESADVVATDLARTEATSAALSNLARLPDDQRDVVRLCYLEGMPVSETAARLGISEGAVRMLGHRALRTLTELMGGEDSPEGAVDGPRGATS